MLIIFVILQFIQTSQNEFFTLQSILTISGASGVVLLISNSLQSALNFNPKWLALLIAQVVSFISLFIGDEIHFANVVLAILNGFLIYSTAVGANQFTGKDIDQRGPSPDAFTPNNNLSSRKFNSKWF